MTIEEGKLVETTPGIYCFRNIINQKCYIGQAVNLRNRFKQHMFNFKNMRYNNPLYKAFAKYGLEQFEYLILEYVEMQDNIKDILDTLEKKYISEHNSYKQGYNQTIGGDYGILGYKMNEEQKQRLSENSKKTATDGRYSVYVYDTEQNQLLQFVNSTEAAKILGGKPNSINSAIRRQFYLKRYIIARSLEDLEDKKNQEPIIHTNDGQFKNKYTLEEYKVLKEQYKGYTTQQLADALGVSRRTICTYNKKLSLSLGSNPGGPTN